MIMKLMTENRLEPLSDVFFDETNDNNYYRKGLSPYIKQVFDEHEITENLGQIMQPAICGASRE